MNILCRFIPEHFILTFAERYRNRISFAADILIEIYWVEEVEDLKCSSADYSVEMH